MTPTHAPGASAREVQRASTVCRMCHGGCGAIVTLADGRPIAIEGDPESPTSRGFFCIKGKASLDLLHSPDRLRTPLRRVGPRGSNRFEPIGWPAALDCVAAAVSASIDRHGAESVVLCQGTDRNYQEWVFRLANAIGTPNVVGPAHVCFYPRVMASILTFGGFTFCDYEGDPEVVLLWGSNKASTHADGVIGVGLLAALSRGSQVVTIDPRRTATAARSSHHLAVRPGTDGALALGMINLVITEGWFDAEFVANHTTGFDELAAHVAPYDLRTVAALTGVDPEAIRAATRAYACAERACIEAGTGLAQTTNAFDTFRAIAILSALCGNLDAPGGDLLWDPLPIDGRRTFPRSDLLTKEQAAKRIGGDVHKVLSMTGWVAPGDLYRAILSGSPYRPSSLLIFGSNILVSHEETATVRKALEALDTVVVCDLFMTPTARYADIILPASSWLERDQVVEFNSYIAARRKVATVEGCRSDEEIILELAKRLGLSEHFFPSLQAALDAKLAGIGMTWDEFARVGWIPNERRYYKYRNDGFRTRSGRVNLANGALGALGYQRLPGYSGPPSTTAELPLIMTSGHHRRFYNTEYHQLPTTARGRTKPQVIMHPETAVELGLDDGDEVELFVQKSGPAIGFRLHLSDEVQPGVVVPDSGWWYPEKESIDAALASSINVLTTAERTDEHFGSAMMRGIPVGIRTRSVAERAQEVDHG